jgi:ABC-type branched-subunit amino acid transport system ATPase component/predicted MFS family arabinose efflux permease
MSLDNAEVSAAASLAGRVLAEEEARLADDQARSARVEMADERMPGVGAEHMPLTEIMRRGGSRTILVICSGILIADFDSAALQVLAPEIQKTFGIGDALLGAIASLTGLFLLLAAIPVGYYGDRVKRTRIISCVLIFFSFFVFLTGLAQTAWQLGVARMGAASGRSTGPVNLSIVADAYPIEGRGRVLAMERFANSFGSFLGPLIAGLIAFVVFDGGDSWRIVFIVLAVPAFLVALYSFTMKEPRRGKNELELLLGDLEGGVVYTPPPLANAFARLRNIKTFYYFLVGLAVIGFSLLSYFVFFSLFLENEYGYGPLERGIVLALAASGGMVGSILAGRKSDELYRQDPRRVVLLGAGLLAGFMVNVVGLYMPSVFLMVPCLMIGQACIMGSFATLAPVIQAVQPPRLRSQGSSLVYVYLFGIGGFGGSILVGALSDSVGERTALTIALPPALILGAIFIAYGSRFVKDDIQTMVEEIDEERVESERIRAGGTVPVLQVRNLDFSYGPLQILFDVNFDVQRGETLALLGTNGAGKSTLLRAISGLGIPTRGAVRLNGTTLTYSDAEARFHDGILQVRGADVWPGISVEDNLRASLLVQPERWKRSEELMAQVFDMFPVLAQRRSQDAASLSGGEQQMVAFGAALMQEPEVLLIDELSLGLAPLVVQELLGVVERLKEAGTTMIIVEQSLNVAVAVADRALFIEKGRIRFDGPTSELTERGDLARAVFLGGEGG